VNILDVVIQTNVPASLYNNVRISSMNALQPNLRRAQGRAQRTSAIEVP